MGNNGGKKATHGPSGSKLKYKGFVEYQGGPWNRQNNLINKYCIINQGELRLLNTGERGGLQLREMVCQTKAISQIHHTSNVKVTYIQLRATDSVGTRIFIEVLKYLKLTFTYLHFFTYQTIEKTQNITFGSWPWRTLSWQEKKNTQIIHKYPCFGMTVN